MELEREVPGVVSLTWDEATQVEGGNMYQAALMLIAAFGAGFRFGYYELGPRLFG